MKPNYRRLNRIAKILEEPQKPTLPKFKMNCWVTNGDTAFNTAYQAVRENSHGKFKSCGTAGCIAGHAVLLWPKEVGEGDYLFAETAARILGLSYEDAHTLFYGYFDKDVYFGDKNLSDITRKQAARAIRKLVADLKAREARA